MSDEPAAGRREANAQLFLDILVPWIGVAAKKNDRALITTAFTLNHTSERRLLNADVKLVGRSTTTRPGLASVGRVAHGQFCTVTLDHLAGLVVGDDPEHCGARPAELLHVRVPPNLELVPETFNVFGILLGDKGSGLVCVKIPIRAAARPITMRQ